MTNTQKRLKRAEVPETSTWDLTAVFATDEAFEKALDELAGAVPFVKALQGSIGSSSQSLLKGIEEVLKINQKLERVYVYSHLKNDRDTADNLYQNLHDKAISILTSVSEATLVRTGNIGDSGGRAGEILGRKRAVTAVCASVG